MFGKRRFYDIIRQSAAAAPREIQERVIRAVEGFCAPVPAGDDITLVVIKVTA
jgi:serine phosphatase RsbU (regulator of sigma subunit)